LDKGTIHHKVKTTKVSKKNELWNDCYIYYQRQYNPGYKEVQISSKWQHIKRNGSKGPTLERWDSPDTLWG